MKQKLLNYQPFNEQEEKDTLENYFLKLLGGENE